ncbi:MAG: tRNA threonylcarbamoyladenosine dehydratase [Armatimonadetes bacterium]|nr:tRNA threonylcarbamoyladenosine dehydratase [Armatimonadota bacterium]
MVGDEGLARLHSAFVAVVGLGAVGSYATEALARAGIGRLRLVDFDVIRPSNINRQLLALESTIGQPKAEAARERVLDINPSCQVEAFKIFVHGDTLGQVLAGPPDLVIDAIDSMRPKVELLAGCIQRGVPVISSMGAALRTDPTRIRCGPLSATQCCPLARRVRKALRARGLDAGISCIYSDEPADTRFVVPPEESGEPWCDEFARGRPRRALGSLPTLTGIFGLFAANEALRILLGDLFPGSKSG